MPKRHKACFILLDEEVDKVEVAMYEISAKDETFRYKIYRRKNGGYILVLEDEDIDRLHSRAIWVRANLFSNSKLYWVKKA